MRLYSNSFAPSPRRVRMFAAEKALVIDMVQVDLARQENRRADYLALNPTGDVPTLVLDDGTVLTESLAICRFLEELHPTPPLLGTDSRSRSRINELVDRLMFRLYVPATQAFRHTHAFWAERLTQVPAYGELARESIRQEFAILNSMLADGRPFLLGDVLTLADIVAYTSVDFAKVGGVRPASDQTALLDYQTRIGARPSARA